MSLNADYASIDFWYLFFWLPILYLLLKLLGSIDIMGLGKYSNNLSYDGFNRIYFNFSNSCNF